MRSVVLVLAIAACGKSAEPRPTVRVPDAAPPRPPDARPIDAVPIGMGWMAFLPSHADPSARHDPPPAAAVVIDADGTLHVMASGGTWDALARATTPAAPVAIDQLAIAVLDVDERAGVDVAALRQELAEAGPEEVCHDCDLGEARVSMTYTSKETLPPATPLIVAHPDAPSSVLLAVLDEVGGALAASVDGLPAIEALGFPWANGGWGGADVDDDARTLDLALARDHLAIPAEASPNAPIHVTGRAISDEDLAFLMSDVPGSRHPDAVIDLLVAPAATAADVADAVGILARTGHTVGVGPSPWTVRRR